ncbi:hypothetical protein HOA55_00375 [archaeon]|jgi:CMP-N-acetylneuraminic acid synthetase|nr:hypothetical protein [archaeon]MBT3578288.1 hypothetical protein [archaeon]MBT6819791.1 hypothetical protein [archaeon]MBT6955816.1 hypothetical protein [archaeon]MBT7025573.1 hypothetical protein [archaeon]
MDGEYTPELEMKKVNTQSSIGKMDDVAMTLDIHREFARLEEKLDKIESKLGNGEEVGKYHAVGIIAFKENSERVIGKNLRILEGKPLYKYIIEKALKSNLEKVYVITNCQAVKEEIAAMGAENLEVPDWYFEKNITGDKMISYPAEVINADIYLQLFVTAPFLTSESINKSINILEETNHDSVFTVNKRHDWAWHGGRPITYYPGNLPRSQDAVPLMIETTGLYGITKKALEEFKRRVGNRPYMLEIDQIEGWDIDEPLDFALAELFMKNISKMKDITGNNYGIDSNEFYVSKTRNPL